MSEKTVVLETDKRKGCADTGSRIDRHYRITTTWKTELCFK